MTERTKGWRGFQRLDLTGIAWSSLGVLVSQMIGFGQNLYLARTLDQTQFGSVALVLSTVGVVGVFAGLGFGTTATRYAANHLVSGTAESAASTQTIRGLCVLSTLSVTLGYYALSSWAISHITFALPGRNFLLGSAMLVVCSTISSLSSGFLNGLQRFKAVMVTSIIRALTPAVGIVLLPTSPTAETIIWTLAATGALTTVMSLLVERHYLRTDGLKFGIKIYPGLVSEVASFGLLLTLTNLVYTLAGWTVQVQIANLPHGLGRLAAFSAALQWKNLVTFLPSVTSQSLLAVLSRLNSTSTNSTKARMEDSAIYLNGICAAALAFSIFLIREQVQRLYGTQFDAAKDILVWVLLAGVFQAITNSIATVLIGRGTVFRSLWLNVIWAAFYLGSSVYLIAEMGVIGAVISLVGSSGIHTVLYWVSAKTSRAREGGIR
jgi:O-antigen/teichoic acid export membrane protein